MGKVLSMRQVRNRKKKIDAHKAQEAEFQKLLSCKQECIGVVTKSLNNLEVERETASFFRDLYHAIASNWAVTNNKKKGGVRNG